MTQPMEQLEFPFYCNQVALAAFLTQRTTIEDEQDRLREELRLLKETYLGEFPLRAVLTALKVTRAHRKLAEHAKEPMSYMHQALLEAFIETHMTTLDLERQVPDMTGVTMTLHPGSGG